MFISLEERRSGSQNFGMAPLWRLWRLCNVKRAIVDTSQLLYGTDMIIRPPTNRY